jgi:hypothetical protein
MDIRIPMGMGMDMNFYPRYSRRRILSVTVDMAASGYLQYPIRIRPVAIPSHGTRVHRRIGPCRGPLLLRLAELLGRGLLDLSVL